MSKPSSHNKYLLPYVVISISIYIHARMYLDEVHAYCLEDDERRFGEKTVEKHWIIAQNNCKGFQMLNHIEVSNGKQQQSYTSFAC